MNVVTNSIICASTCGTATATVIATTAKLFVNNNPVIVEADINTNAFGGCNTLANPLNVPIIVFPPCQYTIVKWSNVSTKLFVQGIPVIRYESFGTNIYAGIIQAVPGQAMKLITV